MVSIKSYCSTHMPERKGSKRKPEINLRGEVLAMY